MNEMIDSNAHNQNLGLAKNLWQLRQTLDVYCLISANAESIREKGVGKRFFDFLRMTCPQLITLYICKIFEEEKLGKQGRVIYELDSIGGVLRSIDEKNASALNPKKINEFGQKYGSNSDNDVPAILRTIVKTFRKEHDEYLQRFKDLRDKWVAHPESGFNLADVPSYDTMEKLFDFGLDFYNVVSRAFIGIGPADLKSDRRVKMSLKGILQKLGCEDIKTKLM